MRFMPYEASWHLRLISKASIDLVDARHPRRYGRHPSWNSTRHAMFMKTDDKQPHPDMLEDVQLHHLRRPHASRDILPALTNSTPPGPDRTMLETLRPDLDHFHRVIVSFALHLRETSSAMLLRQDVDAKRYMTPKFV